MRHAAHHAAATVQLQQLAPRRQPHTALRSQRHRLDTNAGRHGRQRADHLQPGIESRDAPLSHGGPDFAIRALHKRPHIAARQRVARLRRRPLHPDRGADGVVPLQAQAQSTHPDCAGLVPQQGCHLRARQSAHIAPVVPQALQQTAVARVKQIDPRLATDPDRPPRLLGKTGHRGTAGGQQRPLRGDGVQHRHAALLRAHPDAPIGGLEQRLHTRSGQTAGPHRLEILTRRPAPTQALRRAHPQGAGPVHHERLHPVVRQTARCRGVAVGR